MAYSKKSIMQDILNKVKRKKDLSKEIANRHNNVEEFVLKMIEEVDNMMMTTVNSSLGPTIADYYIRTIHQRMRVLDNNIQIEPSWHNIGEGQVPKLNGILIKWSLNYQTENKCEPELFVDIVSLLFK